MTTETLYWHDYETTGSDPVRDRPLQFAGVRTSLELEPIGDPEVMYCQPPADLLPHPDACLLTGISPQRAQREGLVEPAFAAIVQERLGAPGTCGVGWNSLRFDDEITRHLLYRNFFDPYAREWQQGNSRWDLIDLARMAYALRPNGVQWPLREDGAPSFRLEHVAAANGCGGRRAHDALGDVAALLDFARVLKDAQPRLWDWYFGLRRKARAAALLDCARMKPVLHISRHYPATHGCIAMVVPIAAHPLQPNKIIIADLAPDPAAWVGLDVETLVERLFTPRADLRSDVARAPLGTISLNRAPALAPLEALQGVDCARIRLDADVCLDHARVLRGSAGLADRARAAYARENHPPATDAELALYQGFLPDADRPLLAKVRSTDADGLKSLQPRFHDARYRTLLERYRARHHPETLDAGEAIAWGSLRARRLLGKDPAASIGLDAYARVIAQRRAEPGRGSLDLAMLDELEAWGQHLASTIKPHADHD